MNSYRDADWLREQYVERGRTQREIADAKRGTTVPDDVRERIGDSLAGRTKSATTRKRMSEGRTGEQNHRWKGGTDWSYGAGWRAVRDAARERDEVCQICGAVGDDARLEVHHIVPVRLFADADEYEKTDAHFPENVVLLCASCHRQTERGELPWYAPPDTIPDRIGEI